jgi:hypothetical protein
MSDLGNIFSNIFFSFRDPIFTLVLKYLNLAVYIFGNFRSILKISNKLNIFYIMIKKVLNVFNEQTMIWWEIINLFKEKILCMFTTNPMVYLSFDKL